MNSNNSFYILLSSSIFPAYSIQRTMESAKDFLFPYAAFTQSKRINTKPKAQAKTTQSAGSFGHSYGTYSNNNTEPDFHEQMQLKIGKLSVEKAGLLHKVYCLESELNSLISDRDNDAEMNGQRIERFQMDLTLRDKDIEYSAQQCTHLRSLLEETEMKLRQQETAAHRERNQFREELMEKDKLCDQYLNTVAKLEAEAHEKEKYQQDRVNNMLHVSQEIVDPEQFPKGGCGDCLQFKADVEVIHHDKRLAEAKLQQLTEELSAFRKEMLGKLDESEQRKETIAKTLESKNSTISHMEEAVDCARQEVTALKMDKYSMQSTLSTLVQQLESLKAELSNVRSEKDAVQHDLSRKLEKMAGELNAVRFNAVNSISESKSELERRLREAEYQYASLQKDFASQLSQLEAEKGALKEEFDERTAEYATNVEEESKRKVRQLEEKLHKEIQEWKQEYEKMKDNHLQYTKIVNERLEQHTNSLKERYSLEINELQEKIKVHLLNQKEKDKEMVKIRQSMSHKEIDLKNANASISSLHKKIKDLEDKSIGMDLLIKENEGLMAEVNRLKMQKDPATITQAVIRVEREILEEQLQEEYIEKLNKSKENLKQEFYNQVKEICAKHEQEMYTLSGQFSQIQRERNEERVEMARCRSDFVQKKRDLEEQVATLAAQSANDNRSIQQKHELEIKRISKLHDQIIKKIKAENTEAAKKLASAHKQEIQQIEEQQKLEKNTLLRQHREEQRNLLARLTSTVQNCADKEQVHEIQLLRNQTAQMDLEHRRLCTDMEQNFERILQHYKTEYTATAEQLEKRLRENGAQAQQEILHLRKSLTDAEIRNQHLKENYQVEIHRINTNREAEIEKTLATQADCLMKENEAKLYKYQKQADMHIQQLDSQLRELYKALEKSAEIQEETNAKLNMVLDRNEALESNHVFIHKKLRQSTDKFPRVVSSADSLRQLRR